MSFPPTFCQYSIPVNITFLQKVSTHRGIVPITCDELFKTTESNTDPNVKHCVSFSMLEIYNECVRDLLIKNNPKGGLPVSSLSR